MRGNNLYMISIFSFQQIASGFGTEVEKEVEDGKVWKEAGLGAENLVVGVRSKERG